MWVYKNLKHFDSFFLFMKGVINFKEIHSHASNNFLKGIRGWGAGFADLCANSWAP